MMKQISLRRLSGAAVVAAAFAFGAQAQTVTDAARISSGDIAGSARYRAMGGAFGALGADPTAMTDNPAGLGVYRGTSEFTFTPSLSFSKATTDLTSSTKNKKTDFSVSNLAYILSVKTPEADHLVNFNIGIGFNHSAGVERRYSTAFNAPRGSFGGFLASTANNYLDYSGGLYSQDASLTGDAAWGDSHVPLLGLMAYDCYAIDDRKQTSAGVTTNLGGVEGYNEQNGYGADQFIDVREKHRNDEYNLSAGFNWGDVFYAGFTFHISDFNLTTTSYLTERYYDLSRPEDYNGNYTYYDNGQEISGTGVGFNIGLLWRPTDPWRIGAAVHTPTWYDMRESYYGSMSTDYRTDDGREYWSSTDTEHLDYRFYSPWEYQLSTAYVFGSRAVLALEWDVRDYDKMKYLADRDDFEDRESAKAYYEDVNWAIGKTMKAQHTFKGGVEYRLTDQLSLRGGYAYKTSPYDDRARFKNLEELTYSNGQGVIFSTETKPNYTVANRQQLFGGGLGWQGKRWHIDFTCTSLVTREDVAMYPTLEDVAFGEYTEADYIPLKIRRLNYDLTIGCRF